ncbi:protein translocase subunit SecF [Clostridium celatum]|uniref:Protein-export membrane protein SecF n=1 Tax=Clostridium celatum DSM 1785 TaxID=545697 RepID=L1QEW0_9CLOT|nr:protein translocase subunit SecF [Clostridium celatum]EKY26215.1 export membrane protein SecF [Clostridium celatum DSM 1785]MCE9656350.1 protein translocase subunit SecF [Clostridium celatum]MDU6295242.1 protein translocase subunit SecF [Clostridium celatum]MDY3360718.1 protein translocase subunit SecF [Clostridium celatum]
MFKVIEKTKIWFSISLAIILIGSIFMFTRGLNFGIDFKGGTKLVVELGENFNKVEADEIVKQYAPNAVTKTVEKTQYEIKAKDLDETQSAEVFNALKEKYSLEDSALVTQTQVGASVGKELTRNAIVAILIACIAMLIYVAIRFEFAFGVAAILALVHDVLITISVYAIFDIPVNTPFIAAILTIVGYSINDTIVIFDRIRENVRSMRRKTPTEIANISINKTLARSINTSLTTLIIIGAVNIFVPTVREFSLPLLVGIAVGAYSSIFIAAPIWVILKGKKKSKKSVKAA